MLNIVLRTSSRGLEDYLLVDGLGGWQQIGIRVDRCSHHLQGLHQQESRLGVQANARTGTFVLLEDLHQDVL